LCGNIKKIIGEGKAFSIHEFNNFLDLIYFQSVFTKCTCRIRVETLENLKKEKGDKSFLETSAGKTE